MIAHVLAAITITGIQTADSRVESAYWSVKLELGAVSGRVDRTEDRLYLFKNGQALRGFYQQGIGSLDLGKLPIDGRIGKWTQVGRSLRIDWGGQAADQSFVLDNSTYKSNDLVWRPLKRVDGVRLDGLFAREELKQDGAQLMLRSNGSFTFRNSHKTNFIDLSKSAPDRGDGTYELRDWTLWLKFSNGMSSTLSLELPMTEGATSASFVYLATQNFHRWPGKILEPFQPAAVQVGDIEFVPPATWIRKEDSATGASLFVAPGIADGELCTLVATRPESVVQDTEAWHKSVWGPITQGAKLTGSTSPSKVGAFMRSMARIDRAGAPTSWLSLYTTVSKGKGYALMFAANRESLFTKFVLEIEASMSIAKFKN